MKRRNKPSGWGAILAVTVIVAALSEPGHCQSLKVALLLQQTPAQGGTIIPGPGVYQHELNAEVTLMAIPRPGYQFIQWLGDVTQPTAIRTIAYLDKPKIVIAVFDQIEYETPQLMDSAPWGGAHVSGGFASGGLTSRTADYSQPKQVSAGGSRADSSEYVTAEADDEPLEPPIPEPATGVLLLLGSLFVLVRGRGS